MSPRSDIHARLAASLKAARKNRNLSLDAVSKLSGVSRSMVSQIERGESSPTVATLWNLTQVLKVDFAGLVDGGTSGIEVIRAGRSPVIDGLGTGCRIRILSPAATVGRSEIYELMFDAGGRLDSQPHALGCREILTVLDGGVTVVAGPDEARLATGDTGRYAADRPHEITADGGPARALLIVLFE